MKRDVLLESSHGITRLAVAEQGKITEIDWEEEDRPGILQNIYAGRVVQRIPGMNCAFIDLGGEKNAYLDLAEEKNLPWKLQTGQTVLVQVVRESEGEKGPVVSSKIRLTGYSVIYCPFEAGLHVSGKLDRIRKEELSARFDGEDLKGGWVIRTAGAATGRDEMLRECRALTVLWKNILENARTCVSPCLIREEGTLWQRAVRDYALEGDSRLLVDGDALYTEIEKELADSGNPARTHLAKNPVHGLLFDAFRAEEAFREAMQRMVHLPCGGTIVLDETEAMTVIDVNSGKYTGKGNGRFLPVNLEAARETARQIRLRNIGGVVIVDFIDMETEEEREQVRAALAEAVRTDRVPVTVYGFTSLGLLELVRRRRRQKLSARFGSPAGRPAREIPAVLEALEALRAVDRIRLSGDMGDLQILAAGEAEKEIRRRNTDPCTEVIRQPGIGKCLVRHKPGE